MAITAFLFRSPGLLNHGPGRPASLGHGPQSSIFSPTGLNSNCSIRGLRAPSDGCWFSLLHLISNCLTSCLHPWLYNCSTPTFLWASQIALLQPVHGQGYILIFLDRIHLLFTQVHFLILTAWPGQRSIYNTLHSPKPLHH